VLPVRTRPREYWIESRSTEAQEMTAELVSVVMPAFNTERYIAQALRSALDQTHSALEVIVIDDGSTDGTREVVRGFGERVTLLQQARQGAYAARNKGIRAASGRYVAFLDADDYWARDKLATQMAVFRARPEVGVVTTRVRQVDPQGEELTGVKATPMRLCDRVVDLYRELLEGGNMLATSSAMVRLELLESVGLFPGDGHMLSADYDLWLRVAEHTRFYIVSEPLTFYRVLANSMLHGSLEKEYGAQLGILERHRHRYTDQAYQARLAKIFYDWADSAFYVGDSQAWRPWRKSLLHRWFAPRTWLLGAKHLLKRLGVK